MVRQENFIFKYLISSVKIKRKNGIYVKLDKALLNRDN